LPQDLIFDVGCHKGDDTDFYLRKGFRVVAVDAAEPMIAECQARFAAEIADGRVHLVHGALTNGPEPVMDFYISDKSDWSTAVPYFVERSEAYGHRVRKVSVPTVRVSDLFKRFGAPYYMKVDIEGADLVPIQGLRDVAEPPPNVSLEIAHHDEVLGLAQLVELAQLGYRRFNFFNQGTRDAVRLPDPPLEGRYAAFDPRSSVTGPFGQELPGRWLDIHQAVRRFTQIAATHRLFRDHPAYSKNGRFGGTLWSKLHNRYRRHILGDPTAWYDLHAAR
jgi:FkbM family methyltransferase